MNREKRYTPGPWNADPPFVGTLPGLHDIVSAVGGARIGAGQPRNNAHLIAAAPEMLEALEAISHSLKYPDCFEEGELSMLVDMAEKAIAKAYGEGTENA